MDENYVIPKLREDILCKIVEENGEKYAHLFDPEMYAVQPIAIPIGILPFLQMIDGEKTFKDYISYLYQEIGEDTKNLIEPLSKLILYLEFSAFLDSANFQTQKNERILYMNSAVRPYVCAGSSYSIVAEEIRAEMDKLFQTTDAEIFNGNAQGIIVPHIDFRIGEIAHKCYSSGYHSIRNTEADVYVIFGTAHYLNSSQFMLTKKDYITPLGVLETDRELISLISDSTEIHFDDLAHKNEHSIEYQVVLLQSYFPEKKIKILPILVGSLVNYFEGKSNPSEVEEFSTFIATLMNALKAQGKKAVFIASADFSHIGRKFGDNFDAATKLEELKEKDKSLIESLKSLDYNEFYKKIAIESDCNKVCGLSPIYAMLSSLKPKNGIFNEYQQWNEEETKSAVSFASMSFYM